MARQHASVREGVPLSRFGILIAQLESIVTSAPQQRPDALLSFDLLSDLVSAIDEEPKESIILWQRKCEDALYSLLILGARRPVWRLASLAMVKIIAKGDGISIYSRASSLQGWLSDGRRSDALCYAGAAHCLGQLYRSFGRRITSGLNETSNIAAKLMKFHEEFVRQEAMQMLQNALEGSGGAGTSTVYSEAYRSIMRLGISDKSPVVRIAAAKCLTTLANIGGPGLGVSEFEHCASCCVKALEDAVSSVRDAFAEALGALLACGMNPEALPKAKGLPAAARNMEGGLQRHLIWPFVKGTAPRLKEFRVGITLSWVHFLQMMRLKYLLADTELQQLALQAMDMLQGSSLMDGHPVACVVYILRVGVAEQMTEPTQRSFLVLLGKQLESHDASPSMKVAALRTLSFLLTTLGEVPSQSRDILDSTVVAALSHPSLLVRVEAALSLRALAEVDPTCAGNLISCGVTTLRALRESASFEKGDRLKVELDSLHGQAAVLAALLPISPKLLLGCPARLRKSVFDVAKSMLSEYCQNPLAAAAEKEAGWLLLASAVASMPKEELNDQVFDILALWAVAFDGNLDYQTKPPEELSSEVCVWSAAVEALTAFTKSFISSSMTTVNNGILLQPVLVYLSGALSCISSIRANQLSYVKPKLDLLIVRTLIAYQSLADPLLYKSDHALIIDICSTPFREPHACEESSSLRLLLDKRDSCLGPWVPGRDWFEDELRAFEGGTDSVMPCLWENELPSFPQPETLSKMLVNQMLSCLGILFATQDTGGKLMLLSLIEQSFKSSRKQPWHLASTTNACVALLASLKASLVSRPQSLSLDILNSAHSTFQGILIDGDIGVAQRRAACEGLGLLSRLGTDSFTARMTRSLLNDLAGASDSSYVGSLAFALGCIHRSAGGMTLSTLVPATVNSISSLAKSSNAFLQAWSLHGLLLTIEAAGLSFVSHIQGTLMLAMEVMLSDESGRVDLRQGIGRLVNAIVAVLGPELSPGSTFFSRCKSVISETSSGQETSTLLESVRFTQQLALFAPQAVSVHSHVKTLLPTLSSKQPTIRHLAVSTLRHLIEKDPVAVINEHIEGNLFGMLNEEMDSEIGMLVRATIIRLLHASCPSYPSLWIQICRSVVLATSIKRVSMHSSSEYDISAETSEGDMRYGDDDEDMIASEHNGSINDIHDAEVKNDKHLRYRTRVFAAECLSHIPVAVGLDPAHFDLILAKGRSTGSNASSRDWLVLHIQELVGLAFQISTSQFENLQPMGVSILCSIVDKFDKTPDPELPGHLLLEQYQAQLISAVRSALDVVTSGPLLLEAGLQLATKILTSGITKGDQVALQRIFQLISRPLDDIEDVYYPSFAEWVACKIKIRLLAAHASVKSYTYRYLRRQQGSIPLEYASLLPAFSKRSSILGKYWISMLKDFIHLCFGMQFHSNFHPFLVGLQSSLVSSVVRPCLDEVWPVVLEAVTSDSVPLRSEIDGTSTPSGCLSGYSMVLLAPGDFNFLWGLALLVLFQGKSENSISKNNLFSSAESHVSSKMGNHKSPHPDLKDHETALVAFLSLTAKHFFDSDTITVDQSRELVQALLYLGYADVSWNDLLVNLLGQIAQFCPNDYFENEGFVSSTTELCIKYLYRSFQSVGGNPNVDTNCANRLCTLLSIAETLAFRLHSEKQRKLLLALLCASHTCFRNARSYTILSTMNSFTQKLLPLMKQHLADGADNSTDEAANIETVISAWANSIAHLCLHYIESVHLVGNEKDMSKLYLEKLSFCLAESIVLSRLVHEVQCLYPRDDHFCFSIYNCCIKSIQNSIADHDIEVQAVGLQMLRNTMQKELGEDLQTKNYSFLLFIIAECFEDILLLAQKLLKIPVSHKAVLITYDCLKVLVLLHSMSQASESQKDVLNLTLEVIIMISSTPYEGRSSEFHEVKNFAMKLVSHLAHTHSSTMQFKEVMMEMPVIQRQQLQDIIRASVTQDQASVQGKPVAPFSTLKLPIQSKIMPHGDVQPASSVPVVQSGSVNPEVEEEDDWDTFQSFPAATSSPHDETHVKSASVLDENNVAENISHNIADAEPAVEEIAVDTFEDAEDIGEASTNIRDQRDGDEVSSAEDDDFQDFSEGQPFGIKGEVSESESIGSWKNLEGEGETPANGGEEEDHVE